MSFYQTQGNIPPKRHTIFKKNNDNGIFYEEHISREGFSNIYSNIYHYSMPTELIDINPQNEISYDIHNGDYRHRYIDTSKNLKKGDILSSRELLFYNSDILISTGTITSEIKDFYKNAHHDELIYIQTGSAIFESNFGNINLSFGDYLIIPRGVIWRLKKIQSLKCLIAESKGMIRTPKKYRNQFGQLLEHSPFCERDITTPQLQNPIIRNGRFSIKVKYKNSIVDYTYRKHPFDVVGWDGFYFPYKLNINDFEPITGSIHQPPPVHQTFEGDGFVVCSFVSRLFDYHPKAIPAPYPHSNVDSDELIYYSKGNFMSRKGITPGSITHHPMGLPHGPQPGKYEKSIGKKKTNELAVMIDTFKPLVPTKFTLANNKDNYFKSWSNKV